jgi:hypothetical protein
VLDQPRGGTLAKLSSLLDYGCPLLLAWLFDLFFPATAAAARYGRGSAD